MPRRKRKLTWVWGLVFLILIAVAVGVVILVKTHVFGSESGDTTGQNTTNIVEKPEEKKDKGEDKETEDTPKKEEIPQYDGDDPNTAEKLSGVISYAGVSGENLMIRVNIDQYLTSGNCTLNLIKDGTAIYNIAAGIKTSVATATCDGFDVPVAGIGPGKIGIKVILESEDKGGVITGEVEI